METMAQQELHIVLVSNDPQRAYPALQLAMGAAAMGHKATVYATTAGLELLRKGAADKVQLPGYPPLGAILRDAIKLGAKVCACAASSDILKNEGITPETVEPGVKLEDMIGFLNDALPAAQKGGVVTFI
jgi:predicted peroxiredoxin